MILTIFVAESETFGVEREYGEKVVEWLNNEAKKQKKKFEARLYDYEITTQNFGSFEMFSWIGDVNVARELVVRASNRFKIKVIEGSYKPKERIIQDKKVRLCNGKTRRQSYWPSRI